MNTSGVFTCSPYSWTFTGTNKFVLGLFSTIHHRVKTHDKKYDAKKTNTKLQKTTRVAKKKQAQGAKRLARVSCSSNDIQELPRVHILEENWNVEDVSEEELRKRCNDILKRLE